MGPALISLGRTADNRNVAYVCENAWRFGDKILKKLSVVAFRSVYQPNLSTYLTALSRVLGDLITIARHASSPSSHAGKFGEAGEKASARREPNDKTPRAETRIDIHLSRCDVNRFVEN